MSDAVVMALISLGGAVIGSGAITAIVNAGISHKGKTAKTLERIEKKTEDIDEKVDKNEAKRARTQILRFGDELLYQPEVRHTKEHFDEILEQCDLYNDYCGLHPMFSNSRTMQTQEHIQEVYKMCIREHKFLT